MTKPYIVAGCPIKRRAWVARRHVNSLVTQTRRPDSLLYLLNDDGDDGTDEALQSCIPLVLATNRPDSYLERFVMHTYDTGDAGVDRTANGDRPRYSIANLAEVRNKFVELFLEEFPQATHLWSVDSDVLPDPGVLSLLLEFDLDVVSAVVRNSTAKVWNLMVGVDEEGRPIRSGVEEELLARCVNPFPVTLTGACYLTRREVLEAGVRYTAESRGEDEGFCEQTLDKGFWAYVHPLARTSHVQPDGTEWR